MEVAGYDFEDGLWRGWGWGADGGKGIESLDGEVGADGGPCEAGIGDDAVKGALQLADALLATVG